MEIRGNVAVVTGGASGLGRATAERLIRSGAKVLIVDLPSSTGAEVAREIGAFYAEGDVRHGQDMERAFSTAAELGAVRATVHCAGRGGPVRILEKNGNPGSLEDYSAIVELNLIGSFNVLRHAAAAIAGADPIDGERGVIILTASVAAFEGQIGQAPYASSKAGVVGLTLVAARDLASRLIRVCTIAPGLFDTPLLARVSAEARKSLSATVPHPSRLGLPEEFAMLASQIIENPMLNGETIRLDGALRMAAR